MRKWPKGLVLKTKDVWLWGHPAEEATRLINWTVGSSWMRRRRGTRCNVGKPMNGSCNHLAGTRADDSSCRRSHTRQPLAHHSSSSSPKSLSLLPVTTPWIDCRDCKESDKESKEGESEEEKEGGSWKRRREGGESNTTDWLPARAKHWLRTRARTVDRSQRSNTILGHETIQRIWEFLERRPITNSLEVKKWTVMHLNREDEDNKGKDTPYA